MSKGYTLITGSEGFIGKNVTDYFLKKRIKVICLDKVNKLKINKNKNLKFIKINLKNFTKVKNRLSKFKIDCIIHLAAKAGIIDCHNNVDKAFEDNIISTMNVFQLAEKLKVKKIFYFSSLSTFNFKDNPHFYALTKKFSQDLALTQNQYYKKNSCCINLSNVYGEHSQKKKSFIHMMLKAEMSKKELKVYNYGNQKRDFLYVGDISKTLYYLSKKKSIPHQFNLCTSRLATLKDAIKLYQKICNGRLKFKFYGSQKNYKEPNEIKSIRNTKGVKLTNLQLGLIKSRNFYIRNFKK